MAEGWRARLGPGPAARRALTLVLLSVGSALLIVEELRPVSVVPPVGAVAERDIRAGVSFEYVDQLNTDADRRAAEAQVLPVFDFDPKLADRAQGRISDAFAAARGRYNEATLVARAEGRAELTEAERSAVALEFLRGLEFTLDPEDLDHLAALGWSREVEELSRQLLDVAMRAYILPDRSVLPTSARAISVLVLGEQRDELLLEDYSVIRTPAEARQQVSLYALDFGQARPEVVKAAVAIARAGLRPNFSYNQAITEDRRTAAQAAVQPRIHRVARGTSIARAGDVLSAGQVQQLAAAASKQGGVGPLSFGVALAALTGLFTTAVYQFARGALPGVSTRGRDLEAGALLLLLVAGLGRLLRELAEGLADAPNLGLPPDALAFVAPVAGGAMLVRVLINGEAALLWSLLTASVLGMQQGGSSLMALYFALSGLVGAGAVAGRRERLGVLRAGLLTGLVNAAGAVLVCLAQAWMGDETAAAGAGVPLWSMGLAALSGALSGFFVLGLVPLFEQFGFVTDYRLLELANLNHPLLKQLMLRAPGTYHHSVTVAQLSEAAAEAIGANALQTRVACYFHDIGKAVNPKYFVENQRGGPNPHDRLPPRTSARVIINHVTDGEAIAIQHKLPQPVIDGISMHHGTGLIQYFYAKAVNAGEVVDEADYRYPGRLPDTKEAGIMMLADKVEAACRTLKDKSPSSIRALIQKLVNATLVDGQLEKCPLTVKEIYTISDAFSETLLGIYHHRIEYPGVPRRAPIDTPERSTGPIITLELPNPLEPQPDGSRPLPPGVEVPGPPLEPEGSTGPVSPLGREASLHPEQDYESAEHLPREAEARPQPPRVG
ncbi:MAG: HDIG domain-containing protein [Deltaproteobacteria bacterium]|nr:HDIG domain-containing protein [Deltaproteobacteria bacterium]